MNWFLAAVKKYAVFSGRARRAEYWYFALFYLLLYIALLIVDVLTGTFDLMTGYGLCSGVFALAMLVPSLALAVRRLHDIDRSGWWLLIGLIPLVGIIVIMVFTTMAGTRGENRFGPDPLTDPG